MPSTTRWDGKDLVSAVRARAVSIFDSIKHFSGKPLPGEERFVGGFGESVGEGDDALIWWEGELAVEEGIVEAGGLLCECRPWVAGPIE